MMQQKSNIRLGLILARESRGWTQATLAEKIGSTFVSVSRWETGARTPSPYFRRKLGEILQQTEEELDLLPPVIEETPPTPLRPLVPHLNGWGPTLATGGLTIIALIAAGLAWRAPNLRSGRLSE